MQSTHDFTPQDKIRLESAIAGAQGSDGAQGIQGVPGNAGADGAQGIQGIQGIQGPAGNDSTVPGPTGDAGVQGIQGEPGGVGDKGPTGDKGLTGDRGLSGDPGADGDKGATGDAGNAGTAWPVGSVFISAVDTDPNTLLGIGTWAAFGAGRVLVGLDSGDANFDTAEEQGGAKTSTPNAHAGAAVGDHAAKNTAAADVGASKIGTTASTTTLKAHLHSVGAYTHTVTQPSAHDAMSVVQPYVVCYFWKRTA